MTPRAELNALAVASVARHLRRLGCRVATVPDTGRLYVYPAESQRCLTVEVRVAHLCPTRRTVCAGGKRYRYLHRQWHWNLHLHGRAVACDAWVLVRAEMPVVEAMVVPAGELGGLSYSLLDARRRTARGWQWQGRWDVVAGVAARAA